MTAPEASFTTPEILLCAEAIEGNSAAVRQANANAAKLVLVILSPGEFVTNYLMKLKLNPGAKFM
jgi:hypothetical protein